MESVGELELAAQRTTYHVTVYTGDMVGAGTDSDVLVQLFGETEDSGTFTSFSFSPSVNGDSGRIGNTWQGWQQ